MMEWYHNISNNCKKATWLIEKKNLKGISFFQHIELRIHLAGCSICRLYLKQSQLIDTVVDKFYKRAPGAEPALDEGFKEALEKTILKELKNK
jgi:hypothetical protein